MIVSLGYKFILNFKLFISFATCKVVLIFNSKEIKQVDNKTFVVRTLSHAFVPFAFLGGFVTE